MELPCEYKELKVEPTDVNYNESTPQLQFDVNITVENGMPSEIDPQFCSDIDWFIQNGRVKEEPYNDSRCDYDALIEYSAEGCSLCYDNFFDRFSLLRHNLKHLRVELPPVYECPECSACYMQQESLSKHIETEHLLTIIKSIQSELPVTKSMRQCNICSKVLPYKSWHAHVKEVHGQRSFKCILCDYAFKSKRYLRRHELRKHTENPPQPRQQYPNKKLVQATCKLCPTVLPSKSALTTHIRNCHSEEKVKCNLCESTLKCRSYLLTHMRRVHYNDGKEHRCLLCGKNFRSPRYLKIHKKNSHHILL